MPGGGTFQGARASSSPTARTAARSPSMAISSIDDSGATAVDRYSWTYLGSLRTDTGGGLVFPPVAAEPGIYRFLIEDGMQPVAGYIGQAKRSLATRFGLYRSRGKKPKLPLAQKTTSRIDA